MLKRFIYGLNLYEHKKHIVMTLNTIGLDTIKTQEIATDLNHLISKFSNILSKFKRYSLEY